MGAKDLDDWEARRPDGAVVPRLVIVIDEFRSPRSCPTSSPGWCASHRWAARSACTVLATQRPAGVVSADIKANVNLRVALR